MSLSAPLSAMYQDRLLDEYRAPKNRRELPDANGRAERKNPVCGDAMCVMVRVEQGSIAEVAFTGQGCSLAVASASMLTQATAGLSVADARGLAARVDAMLNGGLSELPDVLSPLKGVAPFPARHGCVQLPWLALREALG